MLGWYEEEGCLKVLLLGMFRGCELWCVEAGGGEISVDIWMCILGLVKNFMMFKRDTWTICDH